MAFNEKVESSSPHVVDMKEDIVAAEEATSLQY